MLLAIVVCRETEAILGRRPWQWLESPASQRKVRQPILWGVPPRQPRWVMATATPASSTSSPAPSSGQGADDNYAFQSDADGGADPQGRRQPGEPLCPERVPLEVL